MMDSFSYCLLPALLFVLLLVPINSFELEQINTRKASSSQQVSSGNSLQSFQNPDLWHHPLQSSHRRRQGVSPTTGRKDKSQAGMPPTGTKQLSRLDDDAAGLESLSHGHQERRPAGLQDGSEGVFMGFGIPFHDSDNHAPGSGRKHKEHKKHGRKDKNKHSKGRYTEPEFSPLNKEVEVFGAIPSRHPNVEEEVPSMTTSSSSPSSNQVTATVSEEPLAMSSAAPQTQRPSETRVRPDGEVMPTLDMALFDWTDYEDLKPDESIRALNLLFPLVYRSCIIPWLPDSFLWSNFTVLAIGVWAIAQRDSVDAIIMLLIGMLLTIITDIINISLYFGIHPPSDTFRFSAGMAILSLLLKPASCFFIYQMYRERGGEYNINFGLPTVNRDRDSYESIDRQDSSLPPTDSTGPRAY
ncbi:ATRAP protein, partial [Polypterus senegalus]